MVLINALVAGMLLGQGVLGAAVPRDISARTVLDKNQVDSFLNTIIGKRAAPKLARRQIASESILKPIKLCQLDAIANGGLVKRDAASDSAGFELTDKEKLVFGLAGGNYPCLILRSPVLEFDAHIGP